MAGGWFTRGGVHHPIRSAKGYDPVKAGEVKKTTRRRSGGATYVAVVEQYGTGRQRTIKIKASTPTAASRKLATKLNSRAYTDHYGDRDWRVVSRLRRY